MNGNSETATASGLGRLWQGLSSGEQIATLIILTALVILLLYIWADRARADATGASRLVGWIGIRDLPPWQARILGLVFLAFAVLFFLALLTSFRVVGAVFLAGFSGTTPAQSFSIGALLVALLGAPFLIWRSVVAQKTVDVTEQGLITDRINAAVASLGEEKTRGTGDAVETVPNMEVRIGAIYALERIARENLDFHVQIMEILCAYIRENSPLQDAIQSPHEVFDRLTMSDKTGQGLTDEEAFAHEDYGAANLFGWNPTELTMDNLKEWTKNLPPLRSDIQAALTVIGRRRPNQKRAEKVNSTSDLDFCINLRRTNLQRARLIGDFEHSILDGARLCGAWLEGSFTHALILDASLRALNARKSNFVDSDFSGSTLDAATVIGCDLSRTRFWYCNLKETNFNGATVRDSDFFYGRIQECLLL
ncbi:pentapeptide repeat-containing protein [Rhodophyticola porphyridii]|uniref:pentapeptide repeat-containing protein n=1 Tax=Rhodophyticola porphyridii TaxID=1852017 RepID=UPI0035D0FEBB